MITASPIVRTAGPSHQEREVYEARRLAHLDEARRRLPDHLDRLTWTPERLRAERTVRLRALLRAAREGSPWHRARLTGLDLDTFDEELLSHLPVMTKHDLMTNFDQIVTDHRLTRDLVESHLAGLTGDAYLLDRFHAVASGGSSGQRGIYVYDWESWADCYLGTLRYTIRARLRQPNPGGGPLRLAVVAAEHATHMSSALPRTFNDPTTTIPIPIPITRPISTIVAELNQAQADGLIAYASLLPVLAAEARAGRLRIAPRVLISVSEPLLPEIRAVATETWGVPVLNWWASSEAGGMAISCGQSRGMHLSDDLLIVEPVDAAGNPVPPGVLSDRIYLTNLFNPLLPLIRFEITDQIAVIPADEPCPCGAAHRRIEDVQGRLDDLFTYPEGTIHPHVFRSRLGRDRNIIEYQVRQTERGAAIALRCAGDVDLTRLRRDLSDDLARLGLPAPRITIAVVDHLERQQTGKLKRFVPLARADA